MLLIPAIDIKNGQCVRLRQGDMHDVTVFDDNPVSMAQRWVDEGAGRIHVVDLDGAVAGYPVNEHLIGEIVKAVDPIPVQVGGGIRDITAIETYIANGVEFIILGTKAVSEPDFVTEASTRFPGRIIIGLDARDGMVATDGWARLSEHTVSDLARRFESDGVAAIIHTDISRDGMMSGLNIASTRDLAAELDIPVIASGGVTDMADIDALLEVEADGVCGTIIGRAIYEGTLDLAAARRHVNERKRGC